MQRLRHKIGLALLAGIVLLAAALQLAPDDAPIASLAIGLGVGGLLAWAAAHWIARLALEPIERVSARLDELAVGRFDRRLHDRKGDERDRLVQATNRLSETLAAQHEQGQRAADQLAAVLGSMAEGVLLLDASDRIVLANAPLREMFGAWGSVEDRPVLEVIRVVELDELLHEVRAGGTPEVREIDVRDPTHRVLMMQATPSSAPGARGGLLVVFYDVTELRRLDRVRRDFIANASHELRTPLTAIQGFAETLRTADLAPENRERHLEVIRRNAARMGELIDDLMDLSRAESGETPVDLAPVDVCRVARRLLLDLAPRIERARLEARLTTESAPPATADREAIEQVLQNLLTNAIRYTDPGGRIEVDVQARAEQVELSVSDTGIGIPEEARDRIFERFYRVDAARSRALGSTGLGLAIVRHRVQAMGGTIEVESQVGRGSRFRVKLPRAPQESPATG